MSKKIDLDLIFNTLFDELKNGEYYLEAMDINEDSYGFKAKITIPVSYRKKNNLLFKHYATKHYDCNEIIADNESIYKALYYNNTRYNDEIANKLYSLWERLKSWDSLNEENGLKHNLEKIINAANKGE